MRFFLRPHSHFLAFTFLGIHAPSLAVQRLIDNHRLNLARIRIEKLMLDYWARCRKAHFKIQTLSTGDTSQTPPKSPTKISIIKPQPIACKAQHINTNVCHLNDELIYLLIYIWGEPTARECHSIRQRFALFYRWFHDWWIESIILLAQGHSHMNGDGHKLIGPQSWLVYQTNSWFRFKSVLFQLKSSIWKFSHSLCSIDVAKLTSVVVYTYQLVRLKNRFLKIPLS